jgi:hypothetical protein
MKKYNKLKKCAIYIMFTFLGITSLQAQNFKYGIKAGVNISNLAVSPELDWPAPSGKPGFHLGGFTKFDLKNNFSVLPEIMYSAQGANDQDKDDWQRTRLKYMNLAAPIRYTLPMNIHLFVGPQLGLLMSGEFEEEDKFDGDRKFHNASHLLKGTDLSLVTGLGYTLSSGIEFNLRYNLGLTNINDNPADRGFYEPLQNIKNRVFQISVGYIINH